MMQEFAWIFYTTHLWPLTFFSSSKNFQALKIFNPKNCVQNSIKKLVLTLHFDGKKYCQLSFLLFKWKITALTYFRCSKKCKRHQLINGLGAANWFNFLHFLSFIISSHKIGKGLEVTRAQCYNTSLRSQCDKLERLALKNIFLRVNCL